jgi:5'-nucleotidase/UDP-sugar diphosphatase
MKTTSIIISAIFLLLSAVTVQAGPSALTIVHTNDLHSHLLGGPANLDYTPDRTDDDQTMGGWARIATVIKTVRQDRRNPVLVLDAGDFLMGSLFHLLSREEAFELRLLKHMGYDVVTLGNHEFDLKPAGLARILTTAERYRQIPAIVCSNLIFDPDKKIDDTLQQVFERGLIKPYTILEQGGLRIGIFGLVGRDAAEVAPFASPVKFKDPIETATAMVDLLRNTEKVDLVICLSHSGLSSDPKHSEDEILAQQVDGIDIIISGHTHTKVDRVLNVNGTLIVQAWDYGQQVGVMDVMFNDGSIELDKYQLVAIDDKIIGDKQTTRLIETFKKQIEQQVLAELDLGFDQVVAHTDFDLDIDTRESNLGNLIADSIRWYTNRYDSDPAASQNPVQVAFISNGVIRDPITRGGTGDVAVSDVFRSIPLGIGFDEPETMGYALVSFYIHPAELKKAFEVLTSIYPLKGSDYFLQFSGARIVYNPNRMLFDRVTNIEIGNEEDGYTPLNYSSSNKTLLRVAADIYNSTFLKIVGNFTWQILDIVPKDRDGLPIEDLKSARVDADRLKAGIQELKEWQGVMAYIRNFADTNADNIPDIPAKYRAKLDRNVIAASWNPYYLLKGGTKVTWIAFSAMLIVLVLCALVLRLVLAKIFKKTTMIT